jgi:protocatechuate 3,4-dioxygenase beta subunit
MKTFQKFAIILGSTIAFGIYAAPLKITGIVRDTSGAPVVGVRLSIIPNYGGNRSQILSDSNGLYEITEQLPQFPGAQNRATFLLARSIERNLAAVHEIDEKTTNLDITLQPGLTLSARVQDAKGQPISTATAYVIFWAENFGSSIGSPESADEHGIIRIAALPQGRRYGLNVSAKGYGSANGQAEEIDTQTNFYEFAAMTLNVADRKLAGRVLGTDSKPVAGAQVQIYGEGQPNDVVKTDDKGNFHFDAVCEGPVNVSAYSQQANGNGFTQTSGGDTNVVIQFSANNNRVYNVTTITTSGTVFDSLGAPAANVRLTVSPNYNGMNNVKSDDKGNYSISWQPQPGNQNMQYFLIARDIEHNLAAAQRINQTETNVDVHLQSGFTVSGTVQDANGAPLRRAMVSLGFWAGNYGSSFEDQPIRLDEQGNFTVAALPIGQRYYIFASAKGYGSVTKNLQPPDTQNPGLQLPPFRLKLADRDLAGQVVGADDKPVIGAQVQINGNGQPSENIRTDSSGHFSMKVCEGPVQVFAYTQNNGQFIQGQARATGGDTNVLVKVSVNQPRIARSLQRLVSLKAPPWTFRAVAVWFVGHPKTSLALVGLQLAAMAGTFCGILWCVLRKS